MTVVNREEKMCKIDKADGIENIKNQETGHSPNPPPCRI